MRLRSLRPLADPRRQSLGSKTTRQPTVPKGCLVYLNSSDDTNGGRRLPNRMQPANDNVGNILAFTSGSIPNAGSGAAATPFYAPGPEGGANTATRVVGTAGQLFYLYFSSAPPAGDYTRSIWIKNNGAVTVSISSRSANTTLTQDVAAGAWVEFRQTFTATGANHVSWYITSASAFDLSIDRAQLYEGATVPAWADEPAPSGAFRKVVAWPGSITKSGNVIDNTATQTQGLVRIPNPDWPLARAFSGLTIVAAIKNTVAGSGSIFSTATDTHAGTTSTTAQVGISAAGLVQQFPSIGGLSASGFSRIPILGTGWQIVTMRLRDGLQTANFHEFEYQYGTGAWAGFNARVFRLFGETTAGSMKGYGAVWMVWDRYLSEAEHEDAVAIVRRDLIAMGETISPFNIWTAEGDSRTANAISGGTKYFDALTDPTRMEPNVYGYNNSLGGSTLTDIVGRLPRLKRQVRQGTLCGGSPFVTIWTGTNDAPELIADPVAFADRIIREFVVPLKRISPRVKVAVMTEIDKSTPGWTAAVATFNAYLRSLEGLGLIDRVIDFGASLLGTPGAMSGLNQGGVVYGTDGTHPVAAGTALEADTAETDIEELALAA